jgi:hypothetical protein
VEITLVMEKNGGNYHIKGFSHRVASLLADEISKFLHQNPSLDLVDIKFSSHGYEKGHNDYNEYSAIVICQEK